MYEMIGAQRKSNLAPDRDFATDPTTKGAMMTKAIPFCAVRTRGVSLLAAITVLLALATSATAQEGRSDYGRIEEVIVTAQKREQRSIDVPMSISAVGGDVLERLGINSAQDLSYRIPSLVVDETSPGEQLYTIRGVGNTFGSSALVGIYLDQVDVTSAVPYEQMGVNLYDLARVEVLRGPQGTLWGAGSVGGTIRFITNEPQLDNIGGKAQISVFGQSRGETSYEVKGALNTPLVQDVFGFRFSGTYQNWGGWIDQPAADRSNFNDNELINLRTRALWQPSEEFELNGTVIVSRNEGGGKNIANLPPYSNSEFQTFLDPTLQTPFEDDYDHYNLTMSYDFGALTLLSATGFTDRERFAIDTRRLTFASDFIPGVPGTDFLDSYTPAVDEEEALTQEFRLSSNDSDMFTWTAGVFYRDEETSTRGEANQVVGPIVLSMANPIASQTKNESWAAFGDATFAVTERLSLGAGVRYFEEDRFLADPIDGTSSSGTFDDVSPRIHVSFSAAENINFYANVAQGFRSGGFNPPSVVEAGGPPTYDPEEVMSYELGTKMLLADGRLYTELAVFYSEYTDMQAVGFLPGVASNATSNIGEAEIKGIDWSFVWHASDSLTLGFNGSALETEVVELRADATSHILGDPLDHVSELGYAVTADYDLRWRSDIPGYLRVGFTEQAPVQWTSRAVGLLHPIGLSSTLSFLYANIGATFGETTVELFGRNLLDEAGPSNPYGPCCSLEPQPRPRSIGVRVTHDFD